MKRVSFSVAKAIKEAGYPQEGPLYYTSDGEPYDWNEIEEWDDKYYSKISAPTYLDVWLWLWREKKIAIEILHTNKQGWYADLMRDSNSDPEDAIKNAIEYLVKNVLIK